jgi:hypothetical protein
LSTQERKIGFSVQLGVMMRLGKKVIKTPVKENFQEDMIPKMSL